MFIDPRTQPDYQLRSEERDSTRRVLLKKRPAPPNGARSGGILGYKHLTPNGVKTAALWAGNEPIAPRFLVFPASFLRGL